MTEHIKDDNKGMENTPYIETERLILRKFTERDTKAVFELLKDKAVNTFLPWFPVQNMEEAKRHLKGKYLDAYKDSMGYHYAVCLKDDGIPVGYINVSNDDSCDFGYALRKELWNRGIITEGAAAVIERMKKDGIKYITATHDVNNPASGAVMKKLGMSYKYSYRELWQPKNIQVIFRMYQLNFDGNNERVYMKYWDKYPHFKEENIL